MLRCEGPQHMEKTLRDCKAQATLLLPSVQEQYFSTPVTGLLTTRLISDVYMGFCRQIRAYSGCWPREPEATELQLMCYMPKWLCPAERQDISSSSGLWPAQTMSKISFPLCGEKRGDKDRQLVQDSESHFYTGLGRLAEPRQIRQTQLPMHPAPSTKSSNTWLASEPASSSWPRKTALGAASKFCGPPVGSPCHRHTQRFSSVLDGRDLLWTGRVWIPSSLALWVSAGKCLYNVTPDGPRWVLSSEGEQAPTCVQLELRWKAVSILNACIS